jgi:hypothetical protein
MWYHISDANEYLVVTGAGVDDVRIVKKAFVYPWQRVARISVSPFDFSLNLQAMTIEKLQFALPAVFTIGPDNKPEALKKYALLLSGNPDGTAVNAHRPGTAIVPTQRHHVQDIVKGIIEGETRVIVSSMTMEEIFKERQVFKQKVPYGCGAHKSPANQLHRSLKTFKMSSISSVCASTTPTSRSSRILPALSTSPSCRGKLTKEPPTKHVSMLQKLACVVKLVKPEERVKPNRKFPKSRQRRPFSRPSGEVSPPVLLNCDRH